MRAHCAFTAAPHSLGIAVHTGRTQGHGEAVAGRPRRPRNRPAAAPVVAVRVRTGSSGDEVPEGPGDAGDEGGEHPGPDDATGDASADLRTVRRLPRSGFVPNRDTSSWGGNASYRPAVRSGAPTVPVLAAPDRRRARPGNPNGRAPARGLPVRGVAISDPEYAPNEKALTSSPDRSRCERHEP